MLGKLIKYEFKSTYKIFLISYIIVLAFTIGSKISIELTNTYQQNEVYDEVAMSFLSALSISSSVLMVVSWLFLGFITIITIVIRFYNNMTGQQGYLVHTLPVSVNSLIMSKLIVALSWIALTSIMIIVYIIIFVFNSNIEIIQLILEELKLGLTKENLEYLIPTFISMILTAINLPLKFYCAISIGNLVNKGRILIGIASYIGFGVLEQMFNSIFTFNSMFLNTTYDSFSNMLNTMYIPLYIFTIISIIVYYNVTTHIFKKRLNLQ